MELDHTADQLYLYECEVHLVQLKKKLRYSHLYVQSRRYKYN